MIFLDCTNQNQRCLALLRHLFIYLFPSISGSLMQTATKWNVWSQAKDHHLEQVQGTNTEKSNRKKEVFAVPADGPGP